ncbi:protein N-lysine methyltransferase METTL21A [Sesamum angolense]|uniref:Protein N-lysine methyltransferase METTL21A n=1 Tax=Sesamum angolense TaxID=2727404 RepID=A0AAE1X7G9_9LAMI|nr:protein N-lysine methyltransferase METTL21A [Sesamum angolense]
MAEGAAADEEVENVVAGLGSYGGKVGLVSDCEEEIMLLWAIQQPIFSKHNAFVSQSALQLHIDACGRSLSILQSPSSLYMKTLMLVRLAAVLYYSFVRLRRFSSWNFHFRHSWCNWFSDVDSGIILGKFLEHSVESGTIFLQGKNVIELGSGCGLVGCIAALLGAQVILTDLPDRLKLLKKNVETNLYGDVRGSATVNELTWGDDLDTDITDPSPDFDAILEYFLEAAMKEFVVGRVDQDQWHPDYCSSRVAIYVLVKK